MNARETAILIRRGQLQERIRAQRQQFASDVKPLYAALNTLDRARFQARQARDWLKKRPAVLTATVVALVTWQPRTAFRTLRRTYSLWRSWKQIKRWVLQQKQKRGM